MISSGALAFDATVQPSSSPVIAAAPIRILIVDDSLVIRTVLRQILGRSGGFQVVGEAATVDAALILLKSHQPDIVLLDVVMPGIDGLTALPDIIAAGHGARVVVVSAICEEGAASSVRALALGAVDTLPKPGAGSMGAAFADLLEARLQRIGPIPDTSRPLTVIAPPAPAIPLRASLPGPIDCIAIGSSTGGIHALASFFSALPRAIDAPILLTQHLPPAFMPFFAAQISDMVGRPAQVACDGMRLLPGMILIAPGEGHMTVRRVGPDVRMRIDRTPAISGCMPSVDPMLVSVSETFGDRGVGVILSGMGRDGVIGAEMLVMAGGEVLAQDRGSSVVWGMPRAVAMGGFASQVLPPAALALHVARRMGLLGPATGASAWN